MAERTEPDASKSGAPSELPSDAETRARSSAETVIAAPAGNETQLAPPGNETQLAPSGNETKLAPSGNETLLAPAGNEAQPAPSGNETQIAPSDNETKPASGPASGAPQRYGDFLVIDQLGAGAMGIVYRARQLINEKPTQRIVALKVLKPELTDEPSFEERFFREAEHALNLRHENIVEGFAARKENGVCFLAMELIDGQTLTDLVAERQPLDVGDALRITLDVARGLHHAHASGVYHRDVKPGNVMISSKGEVKVTDLGLAKAPARDLELTHNGQLVGTPVYMAPEQSQLADRPDARFDVYALGGTLFFLLTGVSPFAGATVEEVLAQKRRGATPSARAVRPDVPAEVDALLGRMLARDPAERFQSMDEVIDAITRSGLARPHLSWVEGDSADRPIPPPRRYGAIGAAIAGAAAIAVVLYAMVSRRLPAPPVMPTEPLVASKSTSEVLADAVKEMASGNRNAGIEQIQHALESAPQDEHLSTALKEAKDGVFTFFEYRRTHEQPLVLMYRPAGESLQLAAGAWYRVGLGLTRDCWVYVFQRDPAGEVYRLHPNSKYSSDRNPLKAPLSWIPDKGPPADPARLPLSGSQGVEYIYVLAFNAPMRADALALVEELLRGYADAVSDLVRKDVRSLLEAGDEPAASCFAGEPWGYFSFQNKGS